MVTDLFGSLLQELAHSLEIDELHPDRNNSCLFTLKSGQKLQLELDRSTQFLIIGADLGVVPPGKYRENLFREALKANDLTPPLHGILAFSQKSDSMILFEKISIRDLTGEKIAGEITPFAEKATLWSEAIKNGTIPPVNPVYTSTSRSGMFGLRP